MKYVFLVSHGELAHGMHTALEMFSGENREDILSVGLKNGMGADAFANQVRETLSVVKPEDEILLFADLVGGSPLTNAANVVAEMGLLEKTVMCGGMNLPLVLNAVIMKDTMEAEELLDSIMPEAKDAVRRFFVEAEDAEEDI
ncbi:MAG TPA: PTS fructose transporter subunit IIA [Candidatus Anaerobutyricum avicola]|nr:PTS fructose transporter subunit IIA [Candidatus Anaerobutyricum avicola]